MESSRFTNIFLLLAASVNFELFIPLFQTKLYMIRALVYIGLKTCFVFFHDPLLRSINDSSKLQYCEFDQNFVIGQSVI